jgi:hypothetical protein
VSDIFISYASADRPRVGPLVDALRHQGWSVWWDRTILPGETWDQVIEAALAEARCVIVLWTRESIQSDWVRNEAGEAKRRSILVPALLDRVDIPLEFKRIQAADLAGWRGELPSSGFDELVRAVSVILSRAVSPALEAASHPAGGSGNTVTGAAASAAPTRKVWIRRIGLSVGVLALVGAGVLAFLPSVTGYFASIHRQVPHTFGASPGGGSKSGGAEGTLARPAAITGAPKSATPGDEAIAFSGTWKADVNYGKTWAPVNKTYRESFQFTIIGDEVIGTASLLGSPRAISDGKAHGRNISFITRYPLSEGQQENRYLGEISGDRIQFTYQDADEGAVIRFTATRVKP